MTHADFRRRLTARKPIFGSFLKTPHPVQIEVMAGAGYDCLVLDAEHGPFDRSTLDTMMIAGLAADCPLIVRVPVGSPDWILAVLDMGAAGVMVPHVNSVAQAEALVRAATYGPGGRGYAGTTRAAGYGRRAMTEHLARARSEAVLIAQIEDPEGARNYEAIAAVDGIDALFVGRSDLAVGHGKADFFDPETGALALGVLGATGAATGLYCAPGEDLAPFQAAGGSLFVMGSDHTAMMRGAAADRQCFEALGH